MALPVERDIELYRGDVYEHEFTFVDGDAVALDLSAFSIYSQWRTREDAPTAVDFAVDDSDSVNGIVVISLTPEQTTDLGAKGVYDIQAVDENVATPWEPFTLVRGKVTLTKDVTRP